MNSEKDNLRPAADDASQQDQTIQVEHEEQVANEKAPQNEQMPLEGSQAEESPYTIFQIIDVKIKPGFVLRKVGQAFMVMPTGPRMKEYQGMITLNETGAFLFKEVQKEGATKQKLIDACIAEYSATPEEATKAVDAFILQCAECGLMEREIRVLDKRTGKEVTKDERQS